MDEPFCRICHEGRASGELLSPCECSGSLAMVHRACLEHWLTTSATTSLLWNAFQTLCGVCMFLLCLCGFSLATPVHGLKTCRLG
uniref:RING-CH-type domain-containing protein n=1 Tax=Lates calcarifer TaxID=8187 RepID=A0A4W6CY56_LATCA